MVLYARTGVASVFVPVEDGGCGQWHTRPVTNGAPDKQFVLRCDPCESFLKKDILNAEYKKMRLGNGTKNDLRDRWPGLWGHTPDTVPLSYDEENEQARQEAQLARDAATANQDALSTIAGAMETLAKQNNSGISAETLAKMFDLAAGRAVPEPAITAEPVTEKEPGWEQRACLDCGAAITRAAGQRGGLPHRCPDCRAKRKAA